MKIRVALSENSRLVGESHPNAKLTNAEVDLIHELREGGMTLTTLAARFRVGKAAIWKIVNGYRRCQTPARWITVTIDGGGVAKSYRPKLDRDRHCSPDAAAVRELTLAVRSWFD